MPGTKGPEFRTKRAFPYSAVFQKGSFSTFEACAHVVLHARNALQAAGAEIAHRERGRPVQDEPHRAIVVVLNDQHHRPVEVLLLLREQALVRDHQAPELRSDQRVGPPSFTVRWHKYSATFS